MQSVMIDTQHNYSQLQFDLYPNVNGNFTFNVTTQDDGPMTEDNLFSASVIFTLVIRPVNDVPVFKLLPNMTVLEDDGEYLAGSGPSTLVWNIDAGPKEDNQVLHFEVTAEPSAFK